MNLNSVRVASLVLDAIHAQNTKHAHITESEIKSLDQQWAGETRAAKKLLIDSVLSNRTSAYLMKVKKGSKAIVIFHQKQLYQPE